MSQNNCEIIKEFEKKYRKEIDEHKIGDLHKNSVKKGDQKKANEYKKMLNTYGGLKKAAKHCNKLTQKDKTAINAANESWSEEVEKYKSILWMTGNLKKERDFIKNVQKLTK